MKPPPKPPTKPPAQPAFESISLLVRRLEDAHSALAFALVVPRAQLSAVQIRRYYDEHLAIGRTSRPSAADAYEPEQTALEADNQDREDTIDWAHRLPREYGSVMHAFAQGDQASLGLDLRLLTKDNDAFRTMADRFRRFLRRSLGPAAVELLPALELWRPEGNAMRALYEELQRLTR